MTNTPDRPPMPKPDKCLQMVKADSTCGIGLGGEHYAMWEADRINEGSRMSTTIEDWGQQGWDAAEKAEETANAYAEYIDRLLAENTRLSEIVERLPKTADGVYAYPGMSLFCTDESIVNVHACNCVPVGNAKSILKDICLRQAKWETCYSTREAAEAAREQR